MKTEYTALAGRIKRAIDDLERVVNRAQRLMQQAQRTNDDGYLDGVALNLHSFYAGVEQIFEDIARSVERAIPENPTWHKDLLLQMNAEMPHLRPAVIHSDTRYCLREYLGFRHLVRNVYTFNLNPLRLQELTGNLPECYRLLRQDLTDFIVFLEQLAVGEPMSLS